MSDFQAKTIDSNKPKDAVCAGTRISGYWKGYNCGATPMHFKDGKWWCKNHLPING